MAKRVRREGSGLTRIRIEEEFDDAPKSIAEKLEAWEVHLRNPWENNREFFNEIERVGRETKARKPADVAHADYYRPHDSAEWYYQEIWDHLKIAEFNAARGDVGWAMFHAMKLGELYSEARLKFAHEPRVLPLLEVNDRQRDANKPKMADAERAQLVAAIMAERGKGARDAIRLAAHRRPEGGTESSYRRAYYAIRKASNDTD